MTATRERTLTDAELVQTCLAGSQRGWSAVIDRFGRLVYSIPRRYGMQDGDSEDVFQAVFQTLFEKLPQLRDHERLSSWIITTTHRECWRVSRQAGRTPLLGDRTIEDESPPPDDAAQWEASSSVREGLDVLGDPCRTLLLRLFADGGPPNYAQIASDLDMPVGSIGPTRARCLTKLRGVLEKLGYVQDEQE